MKNNLTDLNNHLFAQLERLGDEELNDEQLRTEIGRSEAIVRVSEQIVNNANLVFKARQAAEERIRGGQLPAMLACASVDKE